METDKSDERSAETLASESALPSPRKKFQSYTNQLDDGIDCSESEKLTATMRSRRELDIYLQMEPHKNTHVDDTSDDNPLLFWKEQQHVLLSLAKLARKTLFIPASSAGVVTYHRRTSINPSTANDLGCTDSNSNRIESVFDSCFLIPLRKALVFASHVHYSELRNEHPESLIPQSSSAKI